MSVAALRYAPEKFDDLLSYYAARIDAVAQNISRFIVETPLIYAKDLSDELYQPVWLKLECKQPIGSFKVRGALNAMMQLSPEARKSGVITASAGNHAQGIALAAKELGIDATIFMPEGTPRVKVDGVRKFGGERVRIVLHGSAFSESLQLALAMQKDRGATFVHPYDDENVIAGQGTIAREVAAQHPGPIEAMFVGVGGGGLAAGTVCVKHRRPNVGIFGVEPVNSDCLHQALHAGRPVTSAYDICKYAEGVAVSRIGDKPFDILRRHIDGTFRVGIDENCSAACAIEEDTGIFPEPAGSLAVAGLRQYAQSRPCPAWGVLVAVVSGRNVDAEKMADMRRRAAKYNSRPMTGLAF